MLPLYLDLLMLLNFLVDFLLLVGTNRLSGHSAAAKRAALAAIPGGLYGGLCMLPGLTFLSGTVWRIASLGLMAAIAFGCNRDSIRRGILFVLLSMALGGVAIGMESGSFGTLVLSAAVVCGMCLWGFRGSFGEEYVSVEIEGVKLTALRDTGNTLKDPVTGESVLVVSPQIGKNLLGLTQQELENPVLAMGKVPGLRLIPYHAVGTGGGLLAAKRFENVKIGKRKTGCLVAFAPNELGQGKPYDALTGGVI